MKSTLLPLAVASLTTFSVFISLTLSAFAAATPRTWSDKSGKFKVEATLVEVSGKNVVLKKTSGSVIKVPLDKLSDADQEFLEQEAKKKPAVAAVPRPTFPPTTGAPAPNGTALAANGKVVQLRGGDFPTGLLADPTPFPNPMPRGNVLTGIPVDAYDNISYPIIVDRAQGIVAVSIGRNIINRPEETRGRIVVGNLSDGSAKTAWDVRESLLLFDYDAERDRALMVSGLDHSNRRGALVLLEGLAKGQPKELYRRNLPGNDQPGSGPKVEWAVLMDGDYVLAQVDREIRAWNMVTAQNLYVLDESKGDVVMTPGRRYLIVPIVEGASVVNPLDGTSLGVLPCPLKYLTPDVACHPDGLQVTLTVGNELVTYDITARDITQQERFGDPIGGRPVGWVTDQLLVTASGGLFQVDLPVIYWRYQFVLAKAVATPGAVLVVTGNRTCDIASLEAPAEVVKKAAAFVKKNAKSAMAMAPGTEVALAAEVIEGVSKEEVLENLSKAVKETGWKVSDRAETTLVAIIGRGQAKSVQYGQIGAVGGAVQTATITPFTAKFEIRRAGKVLWVRETENSLPPSFFLRDGQTLQQEAAKYEQPAPDFFARLNLPTYIPTAESRFGLGFSSIKDGAWEDMLLPPFSGGPNPTKTKPAIPRRRR